MIIAAEYYLGYLWNSRNVHYLYSTNDKKQIVINGYLGLCLHYGDKEKKDHFTDILNEINPYMCLPMGVWIWLQRLQ